MEGVGLLEWLKNDQIFGIFFILELSWVGGIMAPKFGGRWFVRVDKK